MCAHLEIQRLCGNHIVIPIIGRKSYARTQSQIGLFSSKINKPFNRYCTFFITEPNEIQIENLLVMRFVLRVKELTRFEGGVPKL